MDRLLCAASHFARIRCYAAEKKGEQMIIRLSEKLNAKIKAGDLPSLPLDENPFADWSGNLFVADRTQFILVTNTKSLYSTILFGRGVTDDGIFIDHALSTLREFMQYDGQEFVYRRFIAPASGTVRFAKPLDRSVTASMNDLIFHAKAWLIEGELSPFDVACKLNDIPLSSLKFAKPREVFKALHVAQPANEGNEA